jgi:GPI-anchor transamidase subunit GAA1
MGFGYCKTLTPRNFSHERRLTYDITLHLRRHNEMSASPREKIKRLAVACVRRGSFISLCLYVLGLVVASLAPSLARDVYVDENAFLVGSTHATFDDLDGARADDYVETLTKITFDARSRARTTRERLEWVLNALDERGFESYKSWLDGAGDLFNVHSVARAARGNGRESMALVTVLGDGDADAEAATVGLALRAFEKIGRAPWLAKDLMWVCVDGSRGEIDGTMAWLKTYYSSSVGDLGGGFERAGAIQQAFVFRAANRGAAASAVRVKLEGWNGAYPNQDIFTMFRSIVETYPVSMRVSLESDVEVREDDLSRWSLMKSTARFMWRAATGIPSGAHAAFKAHSIDAISFEAIERQQDAYVRSGLRAYVTLGQMLELTFRACNNLLELLHHSCFYYILLGPNKFLGIAEYIAPQAILLVSLLLTALKMTTFGMEDTSSTSDGETRMSHDWFAAISKLSLALVFGAIVGTSCVSLHLRELNHVTVTLGTVAVAFIAFITFLRLTLDGEASPVRSTTKVCEVTIVRQEQWVGVKVINIAWLLFTMSACTFFNFALAFLTTVALAPACLLCAPSGDAAKRNRAVAVLGALPPTWMFVLSRFAGSPVYESFGLLAEHHVRWKTFALPVVFGIAFPVLLICFDVARSPVKSKTKKA